MNTDEIWRNIDEQRTSLAGLLETLSSQQWTTASLCEGWKVRDVAAHVTQSQMGPGRVVVSHDGQKHELEAGNVILAVGSKTKVPPIDGIEAVRLDDGDDVLHGRSP